MQILKSLRVEVVQASQSLSTFCKLAYLISLDSNSISLANYFCYLQLNNIEKTQRHINKPLNDRNV